jgi:hypothetical protein
VGRSGNPGYIDSLPLLVGSADNDNAGAKLVYQDGFTVRGGDTEGTCMSGAFTNSEEINDAVRGDPTLLFN